MISQYDVIDDSGILVYVTKNALTEGIRWKVVQRTREPSTVACDGEYFHGEGLEWHRTEEEARDRLSEMIATRKRLLEDEIETLNVRAYCTEPIVDCVEES